MKRNLMIPLILIFGIGGILRLIYAGRYPDSWDAVDFALAVERYDLYHMQPHFPGYPLYILPSKFIDLWVQDPVRSLTLTSALGGVLTLFFVYLASKRWMGEKGALFTTLLLSVQPLLWLLSEQPMSDSLGLALIWLSIWVLTFLFDQKNITTIGGLSALIFGLAMGIRISYFPFLTMLILPIFLSSKKWQTFFTMAGLFFTGLFLWVIPVAYTEGGLRAFFLLGLSFTEGHFTDWGGTAVTDSHPLERVEQFLLRFFESIFGLSKEFSLANSHWMLLLMVLFLLLSILLFFSRSRKNPHKKVFSFMYLAEPKIMLFFLAIIPYGLWVLIGQNLEKPRHFLPLIPFLIMGFVWIASKVGRMGIGMIGSVFILFTFSSIPAIHQYAMEKPPMVMLTDEIDHRYSTIHTTIFTWEEERVIQYLQPEFHTKRLRSKQDFENQVLVAGNQQTILITNAVLNGFSDQGSEYFPYLKQVFEIHKSSFLYPTYNHIVLYEAKPELFNYLQTKSVIDIENHLQ